MAAINTSGFTVQAQPGLNYLPASQLVGNLGGIIPAASQGAAFVSQLAQIQDQAQEAPIRRQLQQIQMQEAQSRLASAPIDRQIRLAQLAHYNQPLERVLGTDIRRLPRINSPEDSPALDEQGNPTFAEGDTNYDLTPIQRVEVTNPATGLTNIEERKLAPIATAETLGDHADNQEVKRLTAESLAAKRDSDREIAEARLNDPKWRRIGFGVNPNTGKQGYLIMNERTRQIQEVPSDLIPVPTGQDAMLAKMDSLLGGGKPTSPSAGGAPMFNVPNVTGATPAAVAPEDTPALDPEAQSLISDLSSAFQIAPAAASPRSFSSIADVQAAAKAGQLKKGDKITVGGKAATWQ
jgi:hypothetical protein